ncbi:MAG TPA: hypothetical protein VFO91_09700 [Anaerolineales bacterium]|nr:hypothetical protein [Anaerolineales bacterium]
MDNQPTKLEFSQNLRTMFYLQHGEDKTIPLKLIECRDHPIPHGEGKVSLLFQGPDKFVLPGQTYRLRHEHIGEFALFLEAVGSDHKSLYYEAILSHNSQS